MLFSPKFSLSNIHVKLTAKGLLRRLQLLSGFKKNTVVFQAGVCWNDLFVSFARCLQRSLFLI